MRPVIIKTELHYYLYSHVREEFLFLENKFGRFLMELSKKGIFDSAEKSEILEIIESIISDNKIENKANFLFFDKLKILIENDYLVAFDTSSLLDKRINEESIMLNIVNTSQIVFEMTQSCNLKCVYCAYGELYNNEGRKHRHLKYENAVGIIDYIYKQWNSSKSKLFNKDLYISFYGGEPLLRFEMISKLVKYSRNKKLINGNRIKYSMTTNGLLLDRDINFFVEHDFKILISLDGNEEHNRLRIYKNGKSSFKKVFENLEKIRKEYPEYFEKRININSVLHSDNKVSDVTNFLKESFNKTPSTSSLKQIEVNEVSKSQFNEILVKKNNTSEKQDFSIRNDIKAIEVINSYKKRYYYYDDVFQSTRKDTYVPTATCMPFQLKIFVTADGELQTCERIGSNDILGNVINGGVVIDRKTIVSKYNDLFDGIVNSCEKCYRIKNCNLCIFQTDARERIKIKCPQFLNRNDFEMEMTKVIKYIEGSPELNSCVINNSVGEIS